MRAMTVSLSVAVAICFPASPLVRAGEEPARVASPAPAAAEAQAAPATARDILNLDSRWRWHLRMRDPKAHKPDGEALSLPGISGLGPEPFYPLDTPQVADGWQAPDFDDSLWPQTSLDPHDPASVSRIAQTYLASNTLSLRGKFEVSDPASVGQLSLDMEFLGGAVVYLNGREVAREGLPAGDLKPNVAATSYPPEAWLDVDGKKALPSPDIVRYVKLSADDVKEILRRQALRDRSIGPIDLPANLLVKGVNVLAVQIRRTDYNNQAIQGWYYAATDRQRAANPHWVPMGVKALSLQATGAGVTSNCVPPVGCRVWTADPNDRVLGREWPDPCEPLAPIRLVGARNGVFAGLMLVGSDKPIKGLKTPATELKPVDGGPAGSAALPASCVRLLFAHEAVLTSRRPGYCDWLQQDPPPVVAVGEAGRAVQAIWVSVAVPESTAPGAYQGAVQVSSEGMAAVTVPVRLEVIDWRIPDPKDFKTIVGIYESPATLAATYKVEEWSQEHWKLVERSFRLLSEVGCKFANVDVVDQTAFGNNNGMITWVRKADGTYDYDWTVLERYLRLVVEYLGTKPYVAFQVIHAGGWRQRSLDQENTVTVRDQATGKIEHMQVPVFGSEESREFWKPVIDGIRQRMAAVGLEKTMCLGNIADGGLNPAVAKMFNEIWPGAQWYHSQHNPSRSFGPSPLGGGGSVVYKEEVYSHTPLPFEKAFPLRLDALDVIYFPRNATPTIWSPWTARTHMEWSLIIHVRGIGKVGLDYWPIDLHGGEALYAGKLSIAYLRWPTSSCQPGSVAPPFLAYPGKDGAETGIVLESLREGLQTAEAAVLIDEALARHPAELGKDLEARCRQVLHERYRLIYNLPHYGTPSANDSGWQDVTRDLFTIAAEIAAEPKAGK